MGTKTVTEVFYRQFTIKIKHDPVAKGEKSFTWIINRVDGSNLDISEFELQSEQEAVEDAKTYIDDWYKS